MSDMIDQKTLDEYLRRGTEYSRRYRAMHADEPSAEAEQAVLQRLASESAPASVLRRWRRYGATFAMAATMVLAVGVAVRYSNEQRQLDSAPVVSSKSVAIEMQDGASEVPAPPTANAAATEPVAEAKQFESKPNERENAVTPRAAMPVVADKAKAQQAAKLDAVPEEQVARSAPTSAPSVETRKLESNLAKSAGVASPAPLKRAAAEKEDSSEATAPMALEEGVVETALADSARLRATSVADEDRRAREADPIKWLQYIRDLRAANRSADADEEWRRFLKAYPAYPVAPDDRARAP